MPSLKDLRNRIASVKATQKITKAMQMVAAAKLRRAQEAALAARPFSQRMDAVLANLAAAMGNLPGAPQLLTGTGSTGSHLLVVCTAERGLCGAFNASIARLAREHVERILSEAREQAEPQLAGLGDDDEMFDDALREIYHEQSRVLVADGASNSRRF